MSIGSPILAFFRLLAFFLVLALLLPIQILIYWWCPERVFKMPRIIHRATCFVLGIDIRVVGVPVAKPPTFFVANHSSYLDIPILGALVEGSFIAKKEIEGWPVVGFLGKLQRTVYIARDWKEIKKQQVDIIARLEQSHNLILFPEGTSNDGNRVLPFKSALFSVVDGTSVRVQPISISYSLLDGMPLGRRLRPFYAWYGDMSLGPHFWRMAGLGKLTVFVEFHPPVEVSQFDSRKSLAEHAQNEVESGVLSMLYGMDQEKIRSFQTLKQRKKQSKKLKKMGKVRKFRKRTS